MFVHFNICGLEIMLNFVKVSEESCLVFQDV